jgi:hypothetical protein
MWYNKQVIALDLILREGKEKVEILHKELGKLSSNWGIIKRGASEGSILGLLLFLLHFNDLPLGINPASKTTAICRLYKCTTCQ